MEQDSSKSSGWFEMAPNGGNDARAVILLQRIHRLNGPLRSQKQL
jgi:hypothetical protein